MGTTFFRPEIGGGAHNMDMHRLLGALDEDVIPDPPPDDRLAIDTCFEDIPWAALVRNAIARGIITADAPHRLCNGVRRRVLNPRFDAAIRNRAMRIVNRLFAGHDVLGLPKIFRRFADIVRDDPDLWTVFYRHRRAIQAKLTRELLLGPTFTFIVALTIIATIGVPFDATTGAFVNPIRKPVHA